MNYNKNCIKNKLTNIFNKGKEFFYLSFYFTLQSLKSPYLYTLIFYILYTIITLEPSLCCDNILAEDQEFTSSSYDTQVGAHVEGTETSHNDALQDNAGHQEVVKHGIGYYSETYASSNQEEVGSTNFVNHNKSSISQITYATQKSSSEPCSDVDSLRGWSSGIHTVSKDSVYPLQGKLGDLAWDGDTIMFELDGHKVMGTYSGPQLTTGLISGEPTGASLYNYIDPKTGDVCYISSTELGLRIPTEAEMMNTNIFPTDLRPAYLERRIYNVGSMRLKGSHKAARDNAAKKSREKYFNDMHAISKAHGDKRIRKANMNVSQDIKVKRI